MDLIIKALSGKDKAFIILLKKERQLN